VHDNALMLSVIAGPDPYEMFALPDTGVDYVAALAGASVTGLRIAYSPDLGEPPIEPEVRGIVRAAAGVFDGELGAHVEEVAIELPESIDYFIGWWGPQAVMGIEDLAAIGIPTPENDVNRPLIEKVRQMSAVDYARVQFEWRERIHGAFADVFLEHDLLIWPTTPMVAFPHPGPIGGPTHVAGEEARYPVLQNQRYTEAIAHAGYPAITIPAGFTEEGLPVGLQIAASHGADAAVLSAAAVFEQARPWADRRPNL
jgi:Asp-tRNA(Asn)/Glu-tRNA(Gln) amidotransferase A subunit family amidase